MQYEPSKINIAPGLDVFKRQCKIVGFTKMKILELIHKVNSEMIKLGNELNLDFGYEVCICERTNNIFLINNHEVWESGNLNNLSSLYGLLRYIISDLRSARDIEE